MVHHNALYGDATVETNREGHGSLTGGPILGFAAVDSQQRDEGHARIALSVLLTMPARMGLWMPWSGHPTRNAGQPGSYPCRCLARSLYYAVVKSNAACGEWRMNRSTIARHVHPAVFVLIGLLCFGVTMQILGAPVSFWDMDMNETEDLVESSLEEECALPSLGIATSVSRYRKFYSLSPPLDQGILLAQSLFHPPLSHA